MRIERIDRALEQCETHLSSTSTYGTEIENLLTQSLLVLMYAEFERKIKTLVWERLSSITDGSIRKFVKSCDAIRGLKTSDIAGLLGRFEPACKTAFTQKKNDNEYAENLYNSIVINRHDVAHAQGSHVTFREVKRFYEEGHVILDFSIFQSRNEPEGGSNERAIMRRIFGNN
uniref:RiboL-PSP-HEPN domain-containing protein n=1 Tax=Candidatus Kentrum sp. FW TaxID=2126338 RepID=A0A450S7B6_9GAMM|nr:MAG: hypothetical protein BECKFW1821A_GA0114235_101731 [Candidatus Kentron sp. FW]VFJ62298.1 MAG: hypothetical protein BECKFW1821B_GA0114236_107212 [Candidatus Kentron sp. FW]